MSIAVCIPTFGCPKAVEQVLNFSIEIYKKYGIDIYYFDSNEDEETQKIIEKYIMQGYDNLYHIKVNVGFKEKIDIILSGKYLKRKYDYIWPVKNRVFCPEETIKEIIRATEEKNDVIVLGMTRNENARTTTYYDPVKFYGEWAWLMTSLDVVIYRYESMLKTFDALALEKKYPGKYMDSWSIYVFLFSRLAEIESPQIKFLYGDNILKYDVPAGHSTWIQNILTIWVTFWIEANEKLPNRYNRYKDIVIMSAASMRCILGGEERLQELHDMGIFTIESFEKIEHCWKRVSNMPVERARGIAEGKKSLKENTNEVQEAISLLLDMYELVSEGKISSRELPIDNIIECILEIFREKNYYSGEEEVFFANTLADIKNKLLDEKGTLKDRCEMIRIIINFLILMN